MKNNAWGQEADTTHLAVERHLENWSIWQRSGSISRLGYPTKSIGISNGGQSVSGVFEEMCAECDRYAANIVDALVHDLPLDQRGAIYHQWLGCVIVVREQEKSLESAYVSLGG